MSNKIKQGFQINTEVFLQVKMQSALMHILAKCEMSGMIKIKTFINFVPGQVRTFNASFLHSKQQAIPLLPYI